jgi:hypothetical protein
MMSPIESPGTSRADEAGEYQSLSPLAAIALALGVLSPLALVSPLLLAVPAAAAGVALLALAKIGSSEGALTGARIARFGLALAIVFAVATFVRDPVRNSLMRRQTAALAQQWLTHLTRGDFEQSLDFLGGQAIQSLGPPEGGPDTPQPKPEEMMAIVQSKLEIDPLAKRVATFEPPLALERVPTADDAPVVDGMRTLMSEEFLLRGAGEGQSCRLRLGFTRMPAYESSGHPWRIDSWRLLDEASPRDSSAAR